jgi:hypothetical protein
MTSIYAVMAVGLAMIARGTLVLAPPGRPPTPENVVLITLDTLRGDGLLDSSRRISIQWIG